MSINLYINQVYILYLLPFYSLYKKISTIIHQPNSIDIIITTLDILGK